VLYWPYGIGTRDLNGLFMSGWRKSLSPKLQRMKKERVKSRREKREKKIKKAKGKRQKHIKH
jgi:hypothetical protein